MTRAASNRILNDETTPSAIPARRFHLRPFLTERRYNLVGEYPNGTPHLVVLQSSDTYFSPQPLGDYEVSFSRWKSSSASMGNHATTSRTGLG